MIIITLVTIIAMVVVRIIIVHITQFQRELFYPAKRKLLLWVSSPNKDYWCSFGVSDIRKEDTSPIHRTPSTLLFSVGSF
jgi:hypothetical protein